jgi:hypothetical protein
VQAVTQFTRSEKVRVVDHPNLGAKPMQRVRRRLVADFVSDAGFIEPVPKEPDIADVI